jgi:hypothetical protein
MIKAGTALALSLLLAFVLPALVIGISGRSISMNEWYAVTVLCLTTASLYISSLCASGLRAFLFSIAVPVGLLVLMPWLTLTRLFFLPLAGFMLVLLSLALVNHRSAERGMWRAWPQLMAMGGCLAFAAGLLSILSRFPRH